MKRAPALRLAPPPTEPTPMIADIVQGLLDAEQTGQKLLGGISDHQVDRLRQHAGLPAIDLSVGTPGRRAKGLFRYDPVAVRAWWQRRQNGGAA
jgi:hypothetical protein